MAKETWTTVALPILERVSAGETDDPRAATANVLQGVNEHKANLFALASLIDDGYLGGVGVFRPLGRGEPIVTADVLFLTPKGRRAVGQWPTGESGELLIRSLEAALVSLPDGETKGRLSALLEAARSVGTEVLTGVMSSVIKSAAGLPQ